MSNNTVNPQRRFTRGLEVSRRPRLRYRRLRSAGRATQARRCVRDQPPKTTNPPSSPHTDLGSERHGRVDVGQELRASLLFLAGDRGGHGAPRRTGGRGGGGIAPEAIAGTTVESNPYPSVLPHSRVPRRPHPGRRRHRHPTGPRSECTPRSLLLLLPADPPRRMPPERPSLRLRLAP